MVTLSDTTDFGFVGHSVVLALFLGTATPRRDNAFSTTISPTILSRCSEVNPSEQAGQTPLPNRLPV
jgi:hypothetical protein